MKNIFVVLFAGALLAGCASSGRVDLVEAKADRAQATADQALAQAVEAEKKAEMANTRLDRMFQKIMGK